MTMIMKLAMKEAMVTATRRFVKITNSAVASITAIEIRMSV
jgi:hypothetical protein